MFGYVVPNKAELKVREYNVYKAVYCSLCRALDLGYGPFNKYALSYDFAFMAMLGIAADPAAELKFIPGRCRSNPLKRQSFLEVGPALDYSAACLAISTRFKLRDNLSDEGPLRKLGAALALPFISGGYKKARRKYPETAEAVERSIARQAEVESARCAGIDRAADPTATALGFMFEQLGAGESARRILRRLGYQIGRFVYLADAGDDLKADLKRRRYNPLALQYELSDARDQAAIDEVVAQLRPELRGARGEIAMCYNLLELHNFKPILDNIIYLGLDVAIDRVGTELKGTENARSL